MAIAKMKKVTLLAEQTDKDLLLKAVQELQRLELFDLSTLEESTLLDYYSKEKPANERMEYEERLKDIQYSLTYLNQYIPKAGMFAKLKAGREEYTLEELEKSVSITRLKEICDDVSEKEKELIILDQKQKTLNEEELFLRKWEPLSFNPNDLTKFKLTSAFVGTICSGNVSDFKEALKESETNYMDEIFLYKDEAAYLVITAKDNEKVIEEVLNQFQFTKFTYPYKSLPKEELQKNRTENKALQEKERKLKKELLQFSPQLKELQLGEEYYYNLHQREIGKDLLLNGNSLFMLNGWLEEEQFSDLSKLLDEHLGQNNYAIIPEEIKMKEFDIVPVVLKNNKFVEPFESITEMYSLPKYDDIDPTPFMMPFYLVFFGMMSADVGYGLILMVGTLAAQKLFNLDRGTAKFIRFFNLLSYSVIVWGLVYGSFIGYELPIQLLSTTSDVITILIVSVIFGFIQLIYGLLINSGVKWRKQQRASSYVDGMAWVGILLGIGLLVLGMMVFDSPILNLVAYILIGVNVVGIIFVTMLSSESKGLGAALGLYNIYGITGYVGDLVSYTRLMALGISGGSIAAAFNMIVDFLPPVAKFTVGILLFIALHSLNIFLTYLSAYVHTARLQYVEFFGKFYEGGGHALNPLKTFEKHIYLKKDSK
ncbi:V/A-type H+-transporting ATPase subunit I [Carnobacterium iners]|uniref:V/A-type H+-transporting ATPase subunit I n=1 Tax=Carnobacterium iners TaxID=1073423 RepID=A0A1X7NJW1_9LACT|nr:V-type ATP synthase subunit I [Carnobacterium iners]SEK83239.1 V/A-type H+-transporting ATPase subunit I [Carnobacterium iners]SMH38189.1 V/A-type H+-transporting ATPase subunit I [Carnobacterium iners]